MSERFRAVVAAHLFLLRDDSILLLRRANTGYEDGNYSVPAGHLDGAETVTAAAIREAREEIGVVLRPADLAFAGVMHRKAEEERIDFFFAVREWSGEPANCEPDKCDELAWYPMEALPENVVAYVRRAIGNFRDGVKFDEFGWE